eukprot:11872709-Ditylum_brightwellii.AAC.1
MSTEQQEPVVGRKSVRCMQGMIQKLQAREIVVMMQHHGKIANGMGKNANSMICMHQQKPVRVSICGKQHEQSRDRNYRKRERKPPKWVVGRS